MAEEFQKFDKDSWYADIENVDGNFNNEYEALKSLLVRVLGNNLDADSSALPEVTHSNDTRDRKSNLEYYLTDLRASYLAMSSGEEAQEIPEHYTKILNDSDRLSRAKTQVQEAEEQVHAHMSNDELLDRLSAMEALQGRFSGFIDSIGVAEEKISPDNKASSAEQQDKLVENEEEIKK